MAINPKDIPFIGAFPSDDVSEEVKNDKHYGLAYVKAMLNEYWGGEEYVNSTRRQRFIEAKQYREGTQSTDRYKNQLDFDGVDGYANVNLTPTPIIPHIIDVVVNEKTKLDYDIKANAIDPTAESERDKERRRRLMQLAVKPQIQQLEQQTGMQIGGYDKDIDSIEEVELDLQLNFRQATEIAAEQGINFIFDINNFEDVRRQLVDDMCTYNKAGTRTYIDPNYGVRIRPLRPENVGHSHPSTNSFDDIRWAFEMQQMTISEAKRLANGELEEKEWKEISKLASKYNNPETRSRQNYGNIYSDIDSRNHYQYDTNGITVAYFEFIATNKMVYEKKETRFGRSTYNKRNENYKLPEKSKYKRELDKKSYEVVYSGWYIVGANKVFGYKKMNNQLRKNSDLSKTRLSFNIYNISGQSLVQRMIKYADGMSIADLKIQHLVGKMRPPGMVIYDDLLRGVSVDGKNEAAPHELVSIYNKTGIQFAKWMDDDGSYVGRAPFQPIAGGMPYENFRPLLEWYQYNLNAIRQMTGVNETMSGVQPNSEALVGVQKLSLAASSNATRHIDVAWKAITKRTAQSVCLGMQDVIKYSSGLDKALGRGSAEQMRVIKNIPLHEFGIIIDVEPDEVERQYLEANIATSLSAGELRLEDAMLVRSIKNTKLANQMLILRRRKYAQEKAQADQQNIQLQSQVNQQAAMAKMQADAQLEQLKAQLDIAKDNNETNNKAQIIRLEKALEMQIEQLKGGMDIEAAKAASLTKVQLDAYKEDRKDDRAVLQAELQKQKMEEESEDEENEVENEIEMED